MLFILDDMDADDKHVEKSKRVAGCTNVSEQHLREFMEAYRIEFNEDLSSGDASVMLTQLVQFYLQISRPIQPDTHSGNPGIPDLKETAK